MCFCLNILQERFLISSRNYVLCCVIWSSVEKFHTQIVVDFAECCVHVINVVVFVGLVDFVFVVAVPVDAEQLSSAFSLYEEILTFPQVICCFWHYAGLDFLMFCVKSTKQSVICLLKLIYHTSHSLESRKCSRKSGNFRKM